MDVTATIHGSSSHMTSHTSNLDPPDGPDGLFIRVVLRHLEPTPNPDLTAVFVDAGDGTALVTVGTRGSPEVEQDLEEALSTHPPMRYLAAASQVRWAAHVHDDSVPAWLVVAAATNSAWAYMVDVQRQMAFSVDLNQLPASAQSLGQDLVESIRARVISITFPEAQVKIIIQGQSVNFALPDDQIPPETDSEVARYAFDRTWFGQGGLRRFAFITLLIGPTFLVFRAFAITHFGREQAWRVIAGLSLQDWLHVLVGLFFAPTPWFLLALACILNCVGLHLAAGPMYALGAAERWARHALKVETLGDLGPLFSTLFIPCLPGVIFTLLLGRPLALIPILVAVAYGVVVVPEGVSDEIRRDVVLRVERKQTWHSVTTLDLLSSRLAQLRLSVPPLIRGISAIWTLILIFLASLGALAVAARDPRPWVPRECLEVRIGSTQAYYGYALANAPGGVLVLRDRDRQAFTVPAAALTILPDKTRCDAGTSSMTRAKAH